MREVDRVMVEDLHVELVQMMEKAGRSRAELAVDRFWPGSVTVLAGRAATAEVATVRTPRPYWSLRTPAGRPPPLLTIAVQARAAPVV